ncbi:MAG: flagellar hook-length control protein FliK [Lachnospiraceae bacterium]|nr:flagellar hook-length control protein FliK [Lachnospiraceae bacterium]
MNINFDLNNNNQISVGNTQNVFAGENGTVKLNGADALLAGLKAGDSIRAEVVGKDGNTVTLQLPGNLSFDAKISSGLNLDIGKLLTFEVKSSSGGITLSPLFTNMSSDPNVLKALNMAGIPANDRATEMTSKMMQSGMNVDKNSLSNIYKDVYKFSDHPVSDIVDLHKLGIEVNENNLKQIDSYKNLSYELGRGMNGVLDGLSEIFSGDSLSGDVTKGAKLLSDLLNLSLEGDYSSVVKGEEGSQSGTASVPGNAANGENIIGENSANAGATSKGEMSASERALALLSALSGSDSEDASALGNGLISKSANINSENSNTANSVSDNVNYDKANNQFNALGSDYRLDDTDRALLSKELSLISGEDLSGKSLSELFDITKNIITRALENGDTNTLSRLVNSNSVKNALLGSIAEQWSITPQDVADKDKVIELYQKLTKQLNLVKEALDGAGLRNTGAGASAENMSNNLDFLNQVNQMYSYIQLPIKLADGDSAHGDLYVYSNKKRLNDNDGKITALLHLDMEHLGPVDVFVSMDNSTPESKLSTQFYVADDSILDFLNDHMDELTDRLKAKGYSISARASVKGSKEAEDNPLSDAANGGGINGILSQTGNYKLSEYSFDVRT